MLHKHCVFVVEPVDTVLLFDKHDVHDALPIADLYVPCAHSIIHKQQHKKSVPFNKENGA
jgi:hypothetical protein